jgi:primosomal protein N'
MAIAKVEPLTTARALRGPFDYSLPERLDGVGVGSVLLVPFGRRRTLGVVVDVAERSELPDQPVEIAAQERFPARDSQLVHAEAGEDPRDALDLLERQELAARQEAVVVAEDLLRHAVDAAKVAAVRDRDAQVAERPSPRVGEGRRHGAKPSWGP